MNMFLLAGEIGWPQLRLSVRFYLSQDRSVY